MAGATPLDHAIAGTGGSIISNALLFPLDTIRTRLQVSTEAGGIVKVLQDAAKSPEGLLSLYKGFQAYIATIGTSQAVYFWWYNFLKKVVESRQGRQITVTENLALAYVAGAINATVTQPLWTGSYRLRRAAGSDGQKSGLIACIHTIAKQEGVGALFNGLVPAWVLCTNPAIQFLVYERLKMRVLQNAKRLTDGQSFVLGAIAKAVATVVTYPLQIVQTRSQSERGRSVSDVIADIMKNEGFAGFFRGMSSKLLHTVLNTAIMFVMYERLVRYVVMVTRLKSGARA